MLLVLDNCEHLIEPAARLVHVLLARCPDVAVVATSRELLGLPGEVPWSLPGLSLPPAEVDGPGDLAGSDAAALFCARAQASQPGFGLNDANAPAVAQICWRLDGIPLALELAAARIRVLGAHQLAERLDDRFRLLDAGSRGTVPRHQTLRAMMEWSHELLSRPEQTLLRRLAAFSGSFDLEAAEGTVGDETAAPGFDVLTVLGRLVDKSLVVVEADDADVRYRLLETVRHYGVEKLTEADETHLAHRRHCDVFVRLATEWHRMGRYWWETPWMRRVEADRENFQAALDWSLAEAKARFERALILAERAPDAVLHVHFLAGLAPLAALAGEADRAETMAEEAIRIARSVPFRQMQLPALTWAVDAALVSGRFGRAKVVLCELLALLRDCGIRRWVAEALEATALVLEADGRGGSAVRTLEASDRLRASLGESATGPVVRPLVNACRERILPAVDPGPAAAATTGTMTETFDEVLASALVELEGPDPAGPVT